MVYKEEGSIFSIESLNEKVFRLKIFSPNIAQRALPGNFCHLRVNQTYSPLLRRAFSFHQVEKNKNSFELLIKVVGPGTEILSRKNPVEKIDLLAPLGDSFTFPKKNEDMALLAGGMGIAPLFCLMDFLLKKKLSPEKITLFFGVKKKEELILMEELVSSGIKLHIATEDGSAGYKGLITSLFYQELKEKRVIIKNTKFYACGPNPMLKEVSSISRKLNINCQVSLENHMPCGIGACLGCVVNTVKGYKRVCKDGPVFDAREVILD
ncbi:MAG: dihydroorotate dehydrogenase electron transfer subunit [candidate division Zixibacteria bacterium]|nr:dihydroorotate dehydrogenase electron transfer subunit [candidate division Zixibacteria bacterium]